MIDKTLHQRLVDEVEVMRTSANVIQNLISNCNEVPTAEDLDEIEGEAKNILGAVNLYRGINNNA